MDDDVLFNALFGDAGERKQNPVEPSHAELVTVLREYVHRYGPLDTDDFHHIETILEEQENRYDDIWSCPARA
jgi:hypothetical protein